MKSKNWVSTTGLRMSFVADSSDYSTSESDYTSDEDINPDHQFGNQGDNDEEESPSIEEIPVPMSRNAGNRFVAMVFDRALSSSDQDDVMALHQQRIDLTEDHIMFCRKQNLFNETFNTESKADVLWSFQILASDLKRTIGHAMCIESKTLEDAHQCLVKDPIVQSLTGGDTSNIPFFRWRHIRDNTLREDDGRSGMPSLWLAMDRDDTDTSKVRSKLEKDHLEYLIRSERVIAAGPLHLPTELKDDPASQMPVGDLILFNAMDRDEAVAFAENDPLAQAGLYNSMKVHRYNSLDVTGKFITKNFIFDGKTEPTLEMKDAMEYWGYPVDDRQTKWINW
eukprot:CAMPEP_0197832652 /NCGR_PEP_ID=MMETSP1437-20131217/15375_1 /TAXON_ID=49252 ORGANISM="Eucampia antarctica, Strain CCMP1452" /NCGR_SAMPLE_ID=MMETSP1437 /ASSEMBLY_ACC=CAM_ASM_001096 /LENGTH=337 /DNA_ID=CAMNT_0043436113 /DNA_START=206 /DNA_END=1219 /DNA_ORIENTATION=+